MTPDLEFAVKPHCENCLRYHAWRERYDFGSGAVWQDMADCRRNGDLWDWDGGKPCPDFEERPER